MYPALRQILQQTNARLRLGSHYLRGFLRYLAMFAVGICFFFVTAIPCFAQDGLSLSWEDLRTDPSVPAASAAAPLPSNSTESSTETRYGQLTYEQRYDLALIANARLKLERNLISKDGFDAQEAQQLEQKLTQQGLDVAKILIQMEQQKAQRLAQNSVINTALAEQQVKLSGYLLPLERGTQPRASRFLLVPFVGACIHVPPPPPNQVVYVELSAPIERPGLFAPVEVAGKLTPQSGIYPLFRVDGVRGIEASYTLALSSLTREASDARPIAPQLDWSQISSGPWWHNLQGKASTLFTYTMANIQAGNSPLPLVLGVLVAFVYGIIHTLGPGHGKAIVVSYFVGESGSLRRGLWMGGQIAVFHVLAAIIIVGLTDILMRQTLNEAPSNYQIVRLASYAAIALIGGWMLRTALRGAVSSRLRPQSTLKSPTQLLQPDLADQVFSQKKSRLHQPAAICNCWACFDRQGSGGWLSLAIGAVPCNGALLILFYGIANDLLWPSILMVIAISAGMAVTLSWIGVMAIWGRRYADLRLREKRQRYQQLTQWVRVIGASGVLLIGSTLFGLTLVSSSTAFIGG